MITLQDNDSKPKKLSHKQWKALLKKEKRRAKRQAEAKQREEELKARENSPTYLRALLEEELAQKRKEEEEERQRILQHELWLRREEQAQEWWRLKKQREENERKRREEEEQRIREEWEAREKKEKEEAEQRKKEEEERKEKQMLYYEVLDAGAGCDALLKQATANEKQGEDAWHNPILPARAEKPRDLCPFFAKVGVCRFGDRCSRDHPDPDVTNTLLFPGMYTSFKLEQSQRDEYDTDLALEFDDNEIYQHFKEFYNDVLPEFKAVGHVIQFKVCCNYEPHLRGNVYVQFAREDDAYQAMVKFNSRWYAGKQITCQFVKIDRWKNAICGLFHQKKCPKGKACNFLHVFRNPGDEFRDADRDLSPQRFRQRRHGIESSRHRRSRSRSPRYSRSRSYRRESHARSQSRSPKHHRSKSHRKRSHSRSQSRSPRRESGSRYSSRRSRTREESWRKSPDYVSSRQRGQRSRSRSRSLSRSEMHGRRSLESCSRELSPDHRVNGNSDSTADETNHALADVADNKQNDGLPVLNRKRKHKNKNSRSRSRSRSPSKSHKKHKKHKKHKHKRSNDTQLESDEDRNEVVVINSSVISTAVTVTATATSDTDNVAVTQSSLTL